MATQVSGEVRGATESWKLNGRVAIGEGEMSESVAGIMEAMVIYSQVAGCCIVEVLTQQSRIVTGCVICTSTCCMYKYQYAPYSDTVNRTNLIWKVILQPFLAMPSCAVLHVLQSCVVQKNTSWPRCNDRLHRRQASQ